MAAVYKLHSDTILQQWQTLSRLLSSNGRKVDLDGLYLDIAQVVCVSRFVSTWPDNSRH